MKIIYCNLLQFIYIPITLVLLTGCIKPDITEPNNSTELTGEYLDQEMPGMTFEIFAPEIFTEELHAPPIFSSDGTEVYWRYMEYGEPHIYFMKLKDHYWTEPTIAPFCIGDFTDAPFISPDDEKLYFLTADEPENKIRICVVDRQQDGGWGTPETLSEEVNSFDPFGPVSISNNLNLYFGARPGNSTGDIYFSEYIDNKFTTATVLGPEINTKNGREGFPYISPDESYLIFFRTAEGVSHADLFISFKQSDGGWGESIPMSTLNSTLHEFYAYVSPDDRFMMFLSGRTGIMRPYWVDAKIIDDLKPKELKQKRLYD